MVLQGNVDPLDKRFAGERIAREGALGVLRPGDGFPAVSRSLLVLVANETLSFITIRDSSTTEGVIGATAPWAYSHAKQRET